MNSNPPDSTSSPLSAPTLESLLQEWINNNKHRRSDNLWRSPIGKLIRSLVEEQGHWKNAARGNPAQAFRKMRETQMKNI